MTRWWARGVLFLLKHVLGLDHVEYGRENIPDQPCLLVCNHQWTWETIALLVLMPDVAIVAKQELINIPVFAWYLRRSPMIIIDREAGSRSLRAMIDEGRAALAQRRFVLVFPEGTRGSTSDGLVFKRGVAALPEAEHAGPARCGELGRILGSIRPLQAGGNHHRGG